MTGTLADPKLIFSTALKACASVIILFQNHPSGNLKPSQADIALNQKIIKAGSLLDIAVLDHIIITSEGYFSFQDEGIIQGGNSFYKWQSSFLLSASKF